MRVRASHVRAKSVAQDKNVYVPKFPCPMESQPSVPSDAPVQDFASSCAQIGLLVLPSYPYLQFTHQPVAGWSSLDSGSNDLPRTSEEVRLSEEMLARHQAHTCRPCAFLKLGCKYGSSCAFCHLPHTRRTMRKPAKEKRERIRKMVQRTLMETASASSLQPDVLDFPPGTQVVRLTV